MVTYYILLCLHILGATIWVGGHLVLATTILPRALKARKASIITDFEQGYERLGMPALAVQILTGLWLAHHLLGSAANWLGDSPHAHMVHLKLLFLAATVGLAIHAKTRVIPRLRDDNLPVLGAHIVGVTILGVLFTFAGASLRLGGYPLFAS